MITIRDYKESDAKVLRALMFHTIRHINICDYSQAQVEAWAPDDLDDAVWLKRVSGLNPFVAVIDNTVVGYADLQPSGLIDHFFCHHEYQGMGVGRTLMEHILSIAKLRKLKRIHSEVSITARPFYEHFGFKVVQEQQVEIRGQKLTNFVMEKYCG